MKARNRLFLSGCALAMLFACAGPLSQRAFKQELPVAADATGGALAEVVFSSEKKYESVQGVPLSGDPVICGAQGLQRVNPEERRRDRISVAAGEELAVTSVIQWSNTGFTKTCWPLVAFTPEAGARYIVVNERIGGKGEAALFTGIAFQTCAVSVYRELPGGRIEPVKTISPSKEACRSGRQ